MERWTERTVTRMEKLSEALRVAMLNSVEIMNRFGNAAREADLGSPWYAKVGGASKWKKKRRKTAKKSRRMNRRKR